MDTELKERLRACAKTAAPVFDALEAKGFEAWLVGGCVRDILIGENPKDIDLATNATPEESIDAYRAAGLKMFETGLQHGTMTVLAGNEPLEVTTLRTETGHDGRHADVAWTRSLEEDLLRRDLTINAMAATRDGNIIDPFGGLKDLEEGKVRFVGNAQERITEDHLRILRFFRFHARFAGDGPLDPEAVNAIEKGRDGLAKISAERVWMEMSKIIVHPQGATMVGRMDKLGLFEAINQPVGDISRLQKAIDAKITTPAIAMGMMLEPNAAMPDFKWSNDERTAFTFANERHDYNLTQAKYDLVKSAPLEHVSQVTRFSDFSMPEWEVPKFPVAGKDLIDLQMKPGPEMGATLKRLEAAWVKSDYTTTREELLIEAKRPAVNASNAMQAQRAHYAALGQGH